ncbi:MAG: formylglycine-generating enzyme family protein [Dehalococcoidia bacterium]|nr:formylglycine-generating enzyme family protein [Dehalococcoidia bacterium]
MVRVPGGSFLMGSENFYPEEGPVRSETVEGFWIDRYPVTNAAFREFVEATGYVTVAERVPNPESYPGADPAQLVPGSLAFKRPPRGIVSRDPRAWWQYLPHTAWHRPAGPDSTIEARERYPVVHVAYEDAQAYAVWAGKSLPTEAEWEYAARGGLKAAIYVWGNEFAPGGRLMANTWQGEFRWRPRAWCRRRGRGVARRAAAGRPESDAPLKPFPQGVHNGAEPGSRHGPNRGWLGLRTPKRNQESEP